MVRVSVCETYDLSTKVDKMSLIGIHTPSFNLIKKTYPGLLMNHKFIRFTSCNVVLSCASVLPADPQQIGVEAGDIAPQDMFNPIMYKAMSNEAMSVLEARIHGIKADGVSTDKFEGESLIKTDNVTALTPEFAPYYALLANRSGWRVAHPQRGVNMVGLRPLVFERLYNVADDHDFNESVPSTGVPVLDSQGALKYDASIRARSFRGKARIMPPIPTAVLRQSDGTDSYDSAETPYNCGLGLSPKLSVVQTPGSNQRNIMAYVAGLLMPPAKLNKFYFRLTVRWFIDFIGVRPIEDVLGFGGSGALAPAFYGSDYFPISNNAKDCLNMVDVADADIKKIMEGA